MKKFQSIILVLLMILATIDFVYFYITKGTLELFNLGAIYLASGIGLNALKETKKQDTAS